MTRQNSRPAKKKQRNTQPQSVTNHIPPPSLDVVIASPFVPSLPLKAQLREKHRSSNGNESHWQPHPGTIFSSGQCIVGTKKGRDTYTVRIKKPAAATSILNLSPGTPIHLKNAKFVNSYGSKKYREISASSYEVITEKTTHYNICDTINKVGYLSNRVWNQTEKRRHPSQAIAADDS